MKRNTGIAIGVAVVIGGALLAAVLTAGDGPVGGGGVLGQPTVSGNQLVQFSAGGGDAAIGVAAPGLVGQDFSGAEVRIGGDGRPYGIVFLAHWCPHCQAEVPLVQAWLDEGGLPEGVDLYSISTAALADRPNYPPDTWLEQEGWSLPVLADDEQGTAARAFGLSAFPFWVFVDASGTVVGRTTGELPIEVLQTVLERLAAG